MGSDGTKKNRVDPGHLRTSSPSQNNSARGLSGSSYKYVNSAPHT
jgi:hypothetical protein